jgi:hypothetical protein
MLTGKELGEAIDQAMRKKGVSQVEVAAHFGVKPSSVQGWRTTGRIGKDKLPDLWEYFSDTVSMDHWGLYGKASDFPAGTKVQNIMNRMQWPFSSIDQRKVLNLDGSTLLQLEGAILTAAGSLGIDIRKRKAAPGKARAA